MSEYIKGVPIMNGDFTRVLLYPGLGVGVARTFLGCTLNWASSLGWVELISQKAPSHLPHPWEVSSPRLPFSAGLQKASSFCFLIVFCLLVWGSCKTAESESSLSASSCPSRLLNLGS